jgi:hypothetical protein
MRVPFGNDLGFIQEVPKTLVFGTHSNCLDLRFHKPRSKTKRLLNVLAFNAVADISRDSETP